jgi:glutaredoxin
MEFLSQQGVEYVSKDVRADPAALQELAALGSQSTPTIVVGDQTMIGFRPDELLEMIRSD